MNPIQDPSINSLFTGSSSDSTATQKKIDETQDRFLKLLVTQMQNQDPLNPLENAEITSQLAQISTVNGIDKLNDTLKTLVSDFDAMRSLEATTMIGRNVFVPGTSMNLENNVAVAGVELSQPVDQMIVTIKDGSGIAIREIDLGAQPEGVNNFVWDGLTDGGTNAVNGSYSFSVSAKQGNQEIPVTALALGSVTSVEPDDKGTILDVGELGFVRLSDIKQIF